MEREDIVIPIVIVDFGTNLSKESVGIRDLGKNRNHQNHSTLD